MPHDNESEVPEVLCGPIADLELASALLSKDKDNKASSPPAADKPASSSPATTKAPSSPPSIIYRPKVPFRSIDDVIEDLIIPHTIIWILKTFRHTADWNAKTFILSFSVAAAAIDSEGSSETKFERKAGATRDVLRADSFFARYAKEKGMPGEVVAWLKGEGGGGLEKRLALPIDTVETALREARLRKVAGREVREDGCWCREDHLKGGRCIRECAEFWRG